MSTSPPGEAGPLRVPSMDAGTTSLLAAGPTKGSRQVGVIPGGKGSVWVLFDCRGAGKAEIIVESVVNMPFTCLAESLTPTLNKLDLTSKKALRIRVRAPDSVEWALRVTQ
ncbi:hypothetical protein [Nonomuraea sp. NEAU-A123]|uniref:hypothetical protein n=1 Tax=Nonomuraea sp. NEAU-A123 TaxID=2839649 RepID=UPI001BE4BAB5|nr:hypothetical protein [Nonomuraea sp. NEAU-A123]MBT2233851.1 hypothetical protein [Nonomuraea sp. NEAU-A123]